MRYCSLNAESAEFSFAKNTEKDRSKKTKKRKVIYKSLRSLLSSLRPLRLSNHIKTNIWY